jgi:hypothetical protein
MDFGDAPPPPGCQHRNPDIDIRIGTIPTRWINYPTVVPKERKKEMSNDVAPLQLRPGAYSWIDRALNKNVNSGQVFPRRCITGGSGSNGG